jgi:mercuric ion binding protein
MLLFINLKIIKGDPMFIKTLSTALLSIFFSAAISAPASAKNYEINVNGIVCEFCAFGVAKKLRKLDFIDPSQFEDGVKVDIENQRVYISFQEGQAVNQETIFEAIKSGGYDPIKMTPMDEVVSPVEVTQ